MKKKTLMVTGASGFVGRNFIEKYKEEYNIIPVSLRNQSPKDLDYTNIDCILHLAALVHQMKGAPEEKYFEVNTELTKELAMNAKKNGIKHFVFYSTVAVWGTHGYFNHERIITLETPINPKTPYAKSKYQAEQYLESIKNDDFKVSILRPPMIYGKECPGNLPKLEKLIKVLPIIPFGNNDNKRTMVSIEKLLEETELIIKEKKKGIFIPRDDEDKSLKRIVESLEGRKNKINILMPKIIIFILNKIKPNITKSLFGSLRFGGD